MKTQSDLQSSAANADKTSAAYATWAIYSASVLYGVLVYSFDESFPDVVLTPMLALWWLLGIAFFRKPNEVVTVGLILMFFVLGSLIHESIPTLVVRTFSFVISFLLATMFAGQKSRANERLMQITKIIQLVPANVVAADAHGTIIAANDRAADMIGDTFQPICGYLFTDLFMQHYQPSTALKIYREWFERTDNLNVTSACTTIRIGQS